MGWFENENGILLGDGPLDISEQFLANLCEEYEEELGRKPALDEVLATLCNILRFRADEFIASGEGIIVESLQAKLRKKPAKQLIKPGDIFTVPLSNGGYMFGRLTPQLMLMEFYPKLQAKIRNFEELRKLTPIFLPGLVETRALEIWRWQIIGNLPYTSIFEIQYLRFGNMIAIGNTVNKDGFVDSSSEMRQASQNELYDLKNTPILPYNRAEKLLGELSVSSFQKS